MWREMFPDANRGPEMRANEGILDGDISVPEGEANDNAEVPTDHDGDSRPTRSYWTEADDKWVYHKVKPAKGLPVPSQGKNGPSLGTLAGTRVILAKFTDSPTEEKVTLVDWFEISKKKLSADERLIYDRLVNERWTGTASFMKGSFSSSADDAHIAVAKTAGPPIPEWVVRLRTTPGWHEHNGEKLLMTRGPWVPDNFAKKVEGNFNKFSVWTHSKGLWTCVGINMERASTLK